MNKKWLPYILVILLGVILFVVKRFQQEPADNVTTDKKEKTGKVVNRNRGFDRRISYIEYTKHVTCRMDCRRISAAEVQEIMQEGKINYAKSDVNDKPCPSYALEGVTRDNQRVRIVFAQCDLKTKVVTCIDLDTDWSCDCPGDDKKHQNKN